MADDVNDIGKKDDDQAEREHFIRIINAFKFYRSFSMRRVYNAEKSFNSLPQQHQELIPRFLDNLKTIQTCITHNYEIIRLIIKDAEYIFENKTHEADDKPEENLKQMPPTNFDMDKVKTTLKQFVRDWSASGEQERRECYDPVLSEVKEIFKDRDRSGVSILVPGAGLGRLAFEFASCGFRCQGNEWSLFMLLASNFVLNKCTEVNSFTLYPWIHQWTNNTMTADQTQPVQFPDVNPSDLPPTSDFSMAAGDFLEVYQTPDMFDSVVTVFFLDTAHNVIAYIETIYDILKPGGYWVNLGPLLYHYADIENETSIELSFEEVKKVVKKVGFRIQKEEADIPTTYTQNPASMLQYKYHSVKLVCQKPHESDTT
uniref:Carnosine N-methyltransferase n=1 Tax=Magallana gigas TaxID=29159 RepID=K1QIB5_MAGGI|nr:carnosine N-methyltransferase [Crassostrea gigas]|eukprot:XP_011420705.1 PREDICTED: carnosine N-methyltransferase [Crassostrea gigas]